MKARAPNWLNIDRLIINKTILAMIYENAVYGILDILVNEFLIKQYHKMQILNIFDCVTYVRL